MADLPPSYEEVVKNPPVFPRRDQPSVTPSAPPLESVGLHPNYTQEAPFQPVQDPRFSAWDDRATKILVVNRLDMNERFEKCRNQLENHMLWNVILNHLLAAGYNFARINLMQYWKHLFSNYRKIINDLHAGKPIETNWKYFEPIDNVFQYSTKRQKSRIDRDFDTLREALPSQPMFSILYNGIHSEPLVSPRENSGTASPSRGGNSGVVTAQPRAFARGYTPLEASNNRCNNNRNDDDDSCCNWLCGGCFDGFREAFRESCCADNPSAYIARRRGNTCANNRGATSRTNGITSTPGVPAGYSRTGGYDRVGSNTGRSGYYAEATNYYGSYDDINSITLNNDNRYTDNHSSNSIDDFTIRDIVDRRSDGLIDLDDSRRTGSHGNRRHTSSHCNDNRSASDRYSSNHCNDNRYDNEINTSSYCNDNRYDDDTHTSSHSHNNRYDNHGHSSIHSNDNRHDNYGHSSSHANDNVNQRSDESHHTSSHSCHGVSTSHSSHDTGGGGTSSYSCHDSGGGYDGGCDTGGGDDGGCDAGGGGDD